MSTYSTNLGIELIGTGELDGSWGTATNTNLGTLIEQAISGYATQAITNGADTVITIPNGATGVARNMFIECTGALTAARNLVVPANRKLYFIYNNTTGGFAVTVKVSGQTGVSVPNGAKMALVSNGTDIVTAVNTVNLVAPLPIASGGTGATTLAGAAIPTYSSTDTLTNKRITARVNAQISTTSPWAWNSDSFDQQSFSALANALTINADAGTPTDGQKMSFRFRDNGTAQALTWTSGTAKSFRAIGFTLPTTTVASKTLYIGCIYNFIDSRWDVVAVAQEL